MKPINYINVVNCVRRSTLVKTSSTYVYKFVCIDCSNKYYPRCKIYMDA